MEKMEKAKKHATHGITQFALTKQTLNNLSQYDITPTAKLVLLYLTDCYNPQNADVFPKQKTIALKLGVSERSVTRAVQELFKAGLILIECKTSNRYFLRLKNDFDVSDAKNFSQDNLSDDFGNFVLKNEDKLSDSCIEQKKETKKEQQKSDFGNFICCFGEKIAKSENKISENDKLLLKAVENKPWIKNKVAYINKVKQVGGADSLIKEGKALIESENHNKAMLKQTENITKQREKDAELAEPPTDSWKEFGRKHGICKLC